MKRTPVWFLLIIMSGLLVSGCRRDSSAGANGDTATSSLVGAWRAKLQFRNGAFAAIKDLEFMYVYNMGGTMTESSNYDAAPPVPPAYGIWKSIGHNQFEARYEFYATKAPAGIDDIIKGGGWLPAGRGIFTERISLSDDGESFRSTIHYEVLDPSGKSIEGGGDAEGQGVRLSF